MSAFRGIGDASMMLVRREPALPTTVPGEESDLREVAREFESILLNEVFKAMRRTVNADASGPGQGNGGFALDLFTGMLDEELAKGGGASGGFGLAEELYRQLAPAHSSAALEDPSLASLLGGGWTRPFRGSLPILHEGQRFGASRAGNRPEECGGGHCGVDVAKHAGSPVMSAAAGVVLKIGRNPDAAGGLQVSVRHGDDFVTHYLHLEEISAGLTENSRVSGGQALGTVGASGSDAQGVHLHFEIERLNSAGERLHIDPEPLLRLWPEAPVLDARSASKGLSDD